MEGYWPIGYVRMYTYLTYLLLLKCKKVIKKISRSQGLSTTLKFAIIDHDYY